MSSRPKSPRTAWVVIFSEPGYRTKPELEVFTNRDGARRTAREELDPGWRSDIFRVYLDEHHGSFSEPPLPVDDD